MSWRVMEGQGRSRKVMDGLFPSLDWGGSLQDYSVSPSPFPLDFGFSIWDLDLGPRFGI